MIYNIDCIDYMKNCEPEIFDLILTDPPYCVNYGIKNRIISKLRSNRILERNKFFEDNEELDIDSLSRLFFKVLKDNSHCYIFCSTSQICLWLSSMKNAGFKFNNQLIWLKNNSTLDVTFGLKYMLKTENCLFFRKGYRKLNHIGLSNVLKYDIDIHYEHPCQKPVNMMQFLIENSTNEKNIVFDPFAGSGSVGIACLNSNREFIGCEKQYIYYQKILKRFENYQQQSKLSNYI